MIADDVGADSSWQDDVADKQCGLAGGAPQPGRGGAGEDVSGNADDSVDMVSPFGLGQSVTWREDLGETGLVTGTALVVGSVRAIEWHGGLAELCDEVMEGGLVCLDLRDQMNAARGSLLERFF